MRRAPICGFALRLLGASAVIAPPVDAPMVADRAFGEPKLVAMLADSELKESSGVAPSYSHPGWFYTHNDSGDSARFWRFNLKGAIQGPFTLQGCVATDWEDMASVRLDGVPWLYFADIGDNALRRTQVQVVRVREPAERFGKLTEFQTLLLKYPDGPHDAEALLVHPSTGQITLMTKEIGKPARVYTVQPKFNEQTQELAFAGYLRVPNRLAELLPVTGAAVAPDGKRVVVRGYFTAYEYDAADPGWFRNAPREVRLRPESQGEAICYAADGGSLVTTSEGAPCPVSVIPILSR